VVLGKHLKYQGMRSVHLYSKTSSALTIVMPATSDSLDNKHQKCWEDNVKKIDFTHSSHVAWKKINHLTGQGVKPHQCHVSANAIAVQLIDKGNFKDINKMHSS
jgi:hypothetical protein